MRLTSAKKARGRPKTRVLGVIDHAAVYGIGAALVAQLGSSGLRLSGDRSLTAFIGNDLAVLVAWTLVPGRRTMVRSLHKAWHQS
jgi:hypothetical protein